PRAFGPADLARLAEIAAEASRVLGRLWQLEHLQNKARHLETLLTTGRALVAKREPQALFDSLTKDARAMMLARAAALYLFDEAAGTVRAASFAGGDAPALPPLVEFPLNSCLAASSIRTRKAVAFADLQSPEFGDIADLPPDRTLRSALATPLLYEGEVLGVLAVFLDRIHRFDNEQKRGCAALAGLGAVALQNAQLYRRVFRSEESLRKHERLTTLGLLAAEIAHEIRNPLTVLKLLQGGLGLDFPAGDPRLTDLRVIAEKLDQLEGIVTRVLNFAQAPSGLHAPVPLTEIVEDTLVLMRLKLAQGQIRMGFTPAAEPLVVDAHKGQIQQVLLNLLLNALQAMPEGGRIDLMAGRAARGPVPIATLEVTDTGPGIPEAIRDQIFDSFLSGRAGGTGLGLAIAKRVMLSHNGDIVLVASGSGGSTFRIELPLAKT
ncbi:MAG: ATP-binding protein, partial [Opitutaceae bacterium]